MKRLGIMLLCIIAACVMQGQNSLSIGLGVGGSGKTCQGGVPPSGFCPEADTLFKYITDWGSLSGGDLLLRKQKIDTLIRTLKTIGIWSTRDEILCLAAPSEQAALIDWKNPATKTAVNVGGLSLTVDVGYTGLAGSIYYVNTAFNPSTPGLNFSLNSGSFLIASQTNINNWTIDGIVNTGNRVMVYPNYSGSTWGYLNCSLDAGHAGGTSKGYLMVDRINATTEYISLNGTSTSNAVNSVGIPNGNFYLFGLNQGGSIIYTHSRQYSFFTIGGSVGTANYTDFINAIEHFLDYLGCGLLP
jgi:hypothetical protein